MKEDEVRQLPGRASASSDRPSDLWLLAGRMRPAPTPARCAAHKDGSEQDEG